MLQGRCMECEVLGARRPTELTISTDDQPAILVYCGK